MKLHEVVTSGAVGSPEIPKRMFKKTIRRKDVSNIFLDFIRQYDEEKKKR